MNKDIKYRKDACIKTRKILRNAMRKRIKEFTPEQKRKLKRALKTSSWNKEFNTFQPKPRRVMSIEEKVKQIKAIRKRKGCSCKRTS